MLNILYIWLNKSNSLYEDRVLTSQQEERQGGNSYMIQYEQYMTIDVLAAHIQLKFIYVACMFKFFCLLLFLVPRLPQSKLNNVRGEVKSLQSD